MADQTSKLIARLKKHPFSITAVFLVAVLCGVSTMVSSIETIWKAASTLFSGQDLPRLTQLDTRISYEKQKEMGLTIKYGRDNDHKYAIALLVTAKFSNDRYNSELYLRSIADISVTSLPEAVPSSRVARMFLDKIESGAGLKWWVLVTFDAKPKPSHTLVVRLGPRSWSVPIGSHTWYQNHYENGATHRVWESAQAQLQLQLDDPDWTLLRSARLLRGTDTTTSLLEITVENLSTYPVPLDAVAFAASNPNDSGTTCLRPGPMQDLTLNWDVIASEETSAGAWTTISSIPVSVPTRFNGGRCSNFSFFALVPLSSEAPPNSLRRLQIALKELPPTRKKRMRFGLHSNPDPADALARTRSESIIEWASIRVGLNPNKEPFVYPSQLDVDKFVDQREGVY